MGLTPEETIIVQNLLIEDEDLAEFPYVDCCARHWKKCQCIEKGDLTIGVGRNLDKVGISENEAIGLELNDIKRHSADLERSFPWFMKLNSARRVVIVSMSFTMGLEGLKGFRKMLRCLESGDFGNAAKEMVASRWASQVHSRSTRLAAIMKTGQF